MISYFVSPKLRVMNIHGSQPFFYFFYLMWSAATVASETLYGLEVSVYFSSSLLISSDWELRILQELGDYGVVRCMAPPLVSLKIRFVEDRGNLNSTLDECIDYEETFLPVTMLKSIRILLSIVAHYDYEIWQMDTKTAFLNGNLEEEIYMLQLEGFKSNN